MERQIVRKCVKINNKSLIINRVFVGISRVYEEMGEKKYPPTAFPRDIVHRSSQKGFVEVFNVCQKLIRPFPRSKNP